MKYFFTHLNVPIQYTHMIKKTIALKIQDINLNANSNIFWPQCDSLLTQKDRLKKTWCQIAWQREGGHRKHTYSFSHTSLLSSLYLQLPKTAQFRPAHSGEAAYGTHQWCTAAALRRRRQQTLAQLAVLSWMESCTQSFGVRRIFRGLPHYLHYRPWPNAGAIFPEFFRSFRSTKYRMDR